MIHLAAILGIGMVIASGVFCLSVLLSPNPHNIRRGSGASTIPQKDQKPTHKD